MFDHCNVKACTDTHQTSFGIIMESVMHIAPIMERIVASGENLALPYVCRAMHEASLNVGCVVWVSSWLARQVSLTCFVRSHLTDHPSRS